MSTTITISGNTTSPAELRFTPSGKAVASFTVAVNERKRNPQTGEWVDDGATFYPVSAWGQLGENVAETLDQKGMRVNVTGRIKSRTYQNKEGQDVTRFEIDADEVGPSLTWATAKVTRTQNGSGQQGSGQGRSGQAQQGRQQQANRPAASDPWGSAQSEEAPF